MIKVDLSHALTDSIEGYQEQIQTIETSLKNKTCKGNDFLGWFDYPLKYDKEEFKQIQKSATWIQANCDVLVVVGIGGSYLGSRAFIETIKGLYHDSGMEIIFAGNTFSSTYLSQVLKHLEGKRFAVNVISKSGTTTETSIAFRALKKLAEQTYGDKANQYIFATTDANKGILKNLATKEGYQTFVIPDDVGGRYSVFTAVGLLPIACAGIDIEAIMNGAMQAMNDFNAPNIKDNPVYQYAIARHLLYKKGYAAEMFITYELQMAMFSEWWKQLFGESEGKDGVGLLPTSATFSTDLHSLGQFIQDGSKVLFETVLMINEPQLDLVIDTDKENLDELNYLAGKTVDYVNKQAFAGTLEAHVETGKVPNIVLTLDKLDAFHVGYLAYFFMKACAISVLMLGVNPFDQPGVEVYKKNMFKLLGKK